MSSEFCGLCHSVWDTANGDVVAIVCSNKACGSTAYCGDCLRTLYLCTPGGKLAYVPDRRYTEATKGLKDYKLESVVCPHDVKQVAAPQFAAGARSRQPDAARRRQANPTKHISCYTGCHGRILSKTVFKETKRRAPVPAPAPPVVKPLAATKPAAKQVAVAKPLATPVALPVAKPQPAPALTVQVPAEASCSPLPESPDAPTYSLWTSPLAVANPFDTLFPTEPAPAHPPPPSELDALRQLNQDLVGEMREWVAELNNTKALLRNERALCTNLAARLAFASSELNRKEAVLVQLRGALKV